MCVARFTLRERPESALGLGEPSSEQLAGLQFWHGSVLLLLD